MAKPPRIKSYGSMSSAYGSHDDMKVHSQLHPYPQKMPLEGEVNISIALPFRTSRLLGIKKCSYLLIFYAAFYALYLVTGGLVFGALESPLENQIRLGVMRARADFFKKFPEVDEESLETLIEEIVRANNRGVSASMNVSTQPNWSFGQSVFFSSTVVTTIGYGHVTPLSKTGKLFCMLYAMIGIPLTLVLLSATVERLLVPATWLLQALNSKLGHLYQPFNIRLLHLFIIVIIFLTLFLIVPATVFAHLEPEWDFLDSLYYCFISLTTIGLGDYIPGDSPNQKYRPVYKVATTCYLIVGLIFMMLTLTVFYDIPQLNLGVMFASATPNANPPVDRDPEKMRLSSSGMMGPQYTVGGLGIAGTYARNQDERRSVVKVKPHRDDSPSPEDTTPVHAKDMRVH